MKIIDLHEDIALNILYATNKDFNKKHSLHEGNNKTGFAINNNVDLPRLMEGGVKTVFATIFSLDNKTIKSISHNDNENYDFNKVFKIRSGISGALEQLSLYHELFSINNSIKHIKSRGDYAKLRGDQVGFILHLEGIDYLDSEEKLDSFYNLGVRSVALTWRNRNKYGSGNNASGGLTSQGIKLVKKIQEKNIVFDLAHTNNKTFWDIIKIFQSPLIVSHTLCFSICNNSRNLNDEQIKAIAKTGGVVGLACIPDYMGGSKIENYLNHIKYIANLVGIEHIAFGTDFDGLIDQKDRFIKNFEDVSKFKNVISALEKEGFKKREIEKIAFKNVERIIINRLDN